MPERRMPKNAKWVVFVGRSSAEGAQELFRKELPTDINNRSATQLRTFINSLGGMSEWKRFVRTENLEFDYAYFEEPPADREGLSKAFGIVIPEPELVEANPDPLARLPDRNTNNVTADLIAEPPENSLGGRLKAAG